MKLEHILIVEDKRINLEIVKGFLEDTELEIDEARNGKEALEKIELDEIRPSSRKYPFVNFVQDREVAESMLQLFMRNQITPCVLNEVLYDFLIERISG